MQPLIISMTVVLVIAAILCLIGAEKGAQGMVVGGIVGNVAAMIQQRRWKHAGRDTVAP